jgi:hypothetical protein
MSFPKAAAEPLKTKKQTAGPATDSEYDYDEESAEVAGGKGTGHAKRCTGGNRGFMGGGASGMRGGGAGTSGSSMIRPME